MDCNDNDDDDIYLKYSKTESVNPNEHKARAQRTLIQVIIKTKSSLRRQTVSFT